MRAFECCKGIKSPLNDLTHTHSTHWSPAAVAELPEFVSALRQPGLAGLTLLLHSVQLCLQLLTLHAHNKEGEHAEMLKIHSKCW